MKKGVSSLIAWVLLIGFAVTLAVFVSRWSLQQAQKSTEGVEEMVMGDIQCSDVAISGKCEGSNVIITNRGTLTIIGFYEKGKFNPLELKPKQPSGILPSGIYTPVIKIDSKQVVCTTQKQEFICTQS